MSVSDKAGERRIIKDEAIRAYERRFMEQCRIYRNRRISTRFRLFVWVWHSSVRFDLDNSIQMAGAIIDDKLCFQIEAEKRIDKYHPRVEFAIEEINAQGRLFG